MIVRATEHRGRRGRVIIEPVAQLRESVAAPARGSG
jgi:hypothetical protein